MSTLDDPWEPGQVRDLLGEPVGPASLGLFRVVKLTRRINATLWLVDGGYAVEGPSRRWTEQEIAKASIEEAAWIARSEAETMFRASDFPDAPEASS